MEILPSNYKLKSIVSDLLEAGKEKKNAPSKEIRKATDKAAEMIDLARKKGVLNDRDGYYRLREKFDQNYTRINN